MKFADNMNMIKNLGFQMVIKTKPEKIKCCPEHDQFHIKLKETITYDLMYCDEAELVY